VALSYDDSTINIVVAIIIILLLLKEQDVANNNHRLQQNFRSLLMFLWRHALIIPVSFRSCCRDSDVKLDHPQAFGDTEMYHTSKSLIHSAQRPACGPYPGRADGSPRVTGDVRERQTNNKKLSYRLETGRQQCIPS